MQYFAASGSCSQTIEGGFTSETVASSGRYPNSSGLGGRFVTAGEASITLIISKFAKQIRSLFNMFMAPF
jgi:hypothetical protein